MADTCNEHRHNLHHLRILIGIGTGKQTFRLIQQSQAPVQGEFSHAETKEEFSNAVAGEMGSSEDSSNVGLRARLEHPLQLRCI
ncbi:MAG: hypothetical protein DDT28_00351 [Dehalococcoidia bacterium]|nr:hypothetical protein [Chloroflexota bacterium]